jgi:aspartyl-tRNA(Asn)/glutamyl-tRNA(Gln) amidotransferase subunit B
VAVTPAQVARVQALVDAGTVNDKLARQVFDGVLAGEGSPARSWRARSWRRVRRRRARRGRRRGHRRQPGRRDKIRDGKVQAAGALIGQVMKAMRRAGGRRARPRADPG